MDRQIIVDGQVFDVRRRRCQSCLETPEIDCWERCMPARLASHQGAVTLCGRCIMPGLVTETGTFRRHTSLELDDIAHEAFEEIRLAANTIAPWQRARAARRDARA